MLSEKITEKLNKEGIKIETYQDGYIITITRGTKTDKVYIYLKKNRWVFEMWECVPGPSINDFECYYDLLEDAINAAIDYYTGKPTLMNGWLFPLHTHPELNPGNIPIVLRDLVNIGEEAFHAIVERRQHFTKKLFLLNRWKRALLSQFIIIPNIEDNTIYLALRRDMQEFYIVHKE
jgi:hypothetical protein